MATGGAVEEKDILDFEDLRPHFTKTQWEQLKDIEKIIYANKKSNHLFKLSIGLKSDPPEFMRRRNKTRQVEPSSPQLSEEEEEEEKKKDEDEEWTPGPSGRQKAVAVPPSDRELRNLPRINYTEEEEPEDEEYFFCDRCKEFFLGHCAEHGPPVFWFGQVIPVGTPNRAKLTLPDGFQVKRSRIPKAGQGVFYCGDVRLPFGTHFGPYEGVRTDQEEAEKSGYSWVVRKRNNRYVYIDAKDETKSNWMRYVNCARNEGEQNLIAFQYRQGIAYRCCRPVMKGEELLVWYGDEYGKELGIIFDKMWNNKSTEKGPSPQSSPQTQIFCCSECPYAFTSQLFLHKHMKRSHNNVYFQMLRSGQIPPAAAAAASQPISSSSVSDQRSGQNPPAAASQPISSSSVSDQRSGQIPPAAAASQQSTSSSVGHQKQGDTGVKPFHCTQCDKSFTQLGNLKTHELIHTGDKPFHCSQCDKNFTQSGNLKTHERVHTGVKPFQCTQCDKSFSLLCNLKTHKLIHTGEKPFQCTQCDKSFSLLGHLKTHELIHTGDKPFHCSQCDKNFTQSGNLKTHERVHTGVKPFQCTQCDKSFSLLCNLKTHKVIHTGEKPFQCTQCDKSFSLLGHLNRHELIHTGEKPFYCKQCDKSFSRSDNLKVHLLLHT